MSLLQCHQALVGAVNAALAGWQVEHENAEFTKPTQDRWAKVTFVPTTPSVHTLSRDGEDEVDGFMQVDLNYPQNTGDGAARADFEELRAAFPAGASYASGGQTVTIRNCGRSSGRLANQWYRVSVTIYWFAFIPR